MSIELPPCSPDKRGSLPASLAFAEAMRAETTSAFRVNGGGVPVLWRVVAWSIDLLIRVSFDLFSTWGYSLYRIL